MLQKELANQFLGLGLLEFNTTQIQGSGNDFDTQRLGGGVTPK